MTVSVLPEKSQLNSSFNNNKCETTGIVFIDPKVDDYEMLMAGVTPGLEVVLLDENFDGIAQITQALKGRIGLSSLHIVAHGEVGSLWLGKGFVDSNTLEQYKDDLQSWATPLTPDASILLYGCNVAAGETGRQFVPSKVTPSKSTATAVNTNCGKTPWLVLQGLILRFTTLVMVLLIN